MLEVRYWPQSLRLCVQGHAGAGRPGEDLVCAAASGLVWALAEALSEQGAEMPERGRAILQARAKSEEEARSWRAAFDVIAGGFVALGRSYPEHVRMRRMEE